jgi:hypothetical protein
MRSDPGRSGSEGGISADAASGVERFKVIVYLCTAANADPAVARGECVEYADMFGWA